MAENLLKHAPHLHKETLSFLKFRSGYAFPAVLFLEVELAIKYLATDGVECKICGCVVCRDRAYLKEYVNGHRTEHNTKPV